MSEYKRIRKKNQEIREIDRFGVTRIKNGWWIRLGWHNKRPRFQKVIWDKDFEGNHIQSYLKAISVAGENRTQFKSTFRQPTNLVKGVSLCKQRSKSKLPNGKPLYYYCWKFAYQEDGKAKGRTFSFWKTGQIYESYLNMVSFALKFDPDINLEEIDDYFLNYLADADSEILKAFLPDSDLNCVYTETDKYILKNRYLRKSKS